MTFQLFPRIFHGLLAFAALVASQSAEAKIPGATHCYNSICHRVLTLEETRTEVGALRRVVASYYDVPERDASNPSTATSSGEKFRADAADNAASPIYPNGTQLLVRNEATGIAALIRVNNSGPYHPGRQLDVSRALAERLGFATAGTTVLQVVVVDAPSPDEARYARGRRYAAMPGVLGRFTDIQLAALALEDPSALSRSDAAGNLAVGGSTVRPRHQNIERHIAASIAKPTSRTSAVKRVLLTAPQRAEPPKKSVGPGWTGKFFE